MGSWIVFGSPFCHDSMRMTELVVLALVQVFYRAVADDFPFWACRFRFGFWSWWPVNIGNIGNLISVYICHILYIFLR